MDVLSEIKQECAVIACEKWRRQRSRIEFPSEVTDAEVENRLYQVFVPCSRTRETFYKCVIDSILKTGGAIFLMRSYC